jgi:hypothetical protein
MADDVPARMVYAGRRWRVSDVPTPLPRAASCAPSTLPGSMSPPGWRFQATDERNVAFVFDVYSSSDGWHVHRAYA